MGSFKLPTCLKRIANVSFRRIFSISSKEDTVLFLYFKPNPAKNFFKNDGGEGTLDEYRLSVQVSNRKKL